MRHKRAVPDNVVEKIREEYTAGGVSQAQLAKRYGIGDSTVQKILHEEGAYCAPSLDYTVSPLTDEDRAAAMASQERMLKRLAEDVAKEKETQEFLKPKP